MSEPQFANLEAVLRHEVPSRPTLFEFFLNDRLHEQLGGPLDPAEERLPYERRLIRAFTAAGYDYTNVGVPGFGFPRAQQAHAASISQNEGSLIHDRASFEAYPWPDPETADYAALDDLATSLPDGMKLMVAGPSGVLENAINLVGYEDLCLLVHDDPALAQDIFDAIGSRIARYYELAASHATVGVIMGNDDWGHKTQTMLPPPVMRKYVFPWHAANVAAAHGAGKPIILHSCGARHEIMEDVIAMGYDGVHSYEDLIQPVEQAYEQFVGRIAILGGIDVDFLCRSDPETIELRCEAMMARSAFRGGYALGSGNSIPYYVPDESYYAMIDTVRRYRLRSRSQNMSASSAALLALVVVAGVVSAQPAAPTRPLVGAIRWDCWYGATPGGVVSEVERSLGPRKYHFRLPFFAKVVADDTVSINGDSQDVIDREIVAAATAGLDYWAFVDYGDEGDLTIARRRYQAAPDKHGVRYCFVEEGGRLDARGTAFWPRLVQHFASADYVKVCDGRPLLFVFGKPAKMGKAEFAQLGDAAVAAGVGRPYLVFMGWNPEADAKSIAELGMDAVSSYAAGGQYAGTMLSYAALTPQVRSGYWERCRQLHIPTVTFATTGWDTRPRIEHPPRWFPNLKPQPDPTPASAQQPLRDAVTATPEQLATHVKDAIDWTLANPDVTPAHAVILYAWNENDEGGWLIPTLDDGDARLRALAKVLRPAP